MYAADHQDFLFLDLGNEQSSFPRDFARASPVRRSLRCRHAFEAIGWSNFSGLVLSRYSSGRPRRVESAGVCSQLFGLPWCSEPKFAADCGHTWQKACAPCPKARIRNLQAFIPVSREFVFWSPEGFRLYLFTAVVLPPSGVRRAGVLPFDQFTGTCTLVAPKFFWAGAFLAPLCQRMRSWGVTPCFLALSALFTQGPVRVLLRIQLFVQALAGRDFCPYCFCARPRITAPQDFRVYRALLPSDRRRGSLTATLLDRQEPRLPNL